MSDRQLDLARKREVRDRFVGFRTTKKFRKKIVRFARKRLNMSVSDATRYAWKLLLEADRSYRKEKRK